MAAREVIADLHTDGRGGIARAMDRTRLSDRFIAGRRPASDTDRELVDLWGAAAEAGDLHSIRAMGLLHQHGVRCVFWYLVGVFHQHRPRLQVDQ